MAGSVSSRTVKTSALWGLCLLAWSAAVWPLHAPARPNTIRVEEIEPGMRGHGLTVFRGTEPERFDVEVIDVLHDFRPDQDLILIRTMHPRLEQTRSVAGMSGSPIYLDGRLAGAYAYGWGFGIEPIAGVTPIDNMLRELARPLRPLPGQIGSPLPHATKAWSAGESLPAADALAPLRRYARRRRSHAKPRHPRGPTRVATPLLVGGMTPPVVQMLSEHLTPLGLEVMQAGPGGRGKAPANLEYQDGGALAVQLMRGDLQATAVGTVTYVAGQRLLAFGHPMLDGGQVSLPTATARVLHILASLRTSFKIAEALAPRGVLIQDRQAAVVVDRTANPDAIPVRIDLRGVEGLPRRDWRVEVARHDLLTPPLVLSAAASALGAALSDQSPAAFRVRSKVWLEGRPPVESVDAAYSDRGVVQPGMLAQMRPFLALNIARHNPYEQVGIERVELSFDIDFGRHATEIVAASVPSERIDPGDTLPITLTLRRLNAAPEQRVVRLPIPRTFAGEKLKIEVKPGGEVAPITPRPRNFDELLESVIARYPDRSLVVSVERDTRGARLDGHVLHNLPASAVYALAGRNDSGRATPFATEHRTVVPMENVLWGSAQLEVEVRKEPR